MKTYRFAVSNWKNPNWSGFWVYKQFASAYDAGIWADRISFRKPASMYVVSLVPEPSQRTTLDVPNAINYND